MDYRHEASVTNERLNIVMSKLCFGLEMKRHGLKRDRKIREGVLEVAFEA